MNIRLHLRRALLIAKLRALRVVRWMLERAARGDTRQRPEVRRPACEPPEMSFLIEDGIAYTPDLQALVADCRRRAADDFLAYGIGKLQRDGTLEPDWPTSINVRVERDRVEWSLTSRSGHLFVGSYPEHSYLNS